MQTAVILSAEQYNQLMSKIDHLEQLNNETRKHVIEADRKNKVLYNSEISQFLGYNPKWIYKAENKEKLTINNIPIWHNNPQLGTVAYVEDLQQFINQGRLKHTR